MSVRRTQESFVIYGTPPPKRHRSKRCDKPWVVVSRFQGKVVDRSRLKVESQERYPSQHYLILRLPKRHYVAQTGMIKEVPEGWERKSYCKDFNPNTNSPSRLEDKLQPRLEARAHWARTHGRHTRFRKLDE